MVIGYLSVEVTVKNSLVPPSLSVVVSLIMPLLTFPWRLKNIASTKHSPAIDGGRNVALGLYYIFVGGGWKKSTKDDRSSITGGISNIVNGICACISKGSIGDSTSVSGLLKYSVDSKLGRSVTVSAGILSNDDRGLLSLTSNSSSLGSGGVVTMVGV